jgi:hypothetical protein
MGPLAAAVPYRRRLDPLQQLANETRISKVYHFPLQFMLWLQFERR